MQIKDKSKIVGQSRNSSVCANTPYQPKGHTLADIPARKGGPIVAYFEDSKDHGSLVGGRQRAAKVSKGSLWPKSTRKGWRPNGYLPPKIHIP